MPVRSTAVLRVDRPGRYLAQICDHAESIVHAPMQHSGGQHPGGHGHRSAAVERQESTATLTFAGWGSCTIATGDGVLTLQVDGETADGARQIEQVIGADLERFGRRDGVTVTWQQDD